MPLYINNPFMFLFCLLDAASGRGMTVTCCLALGR